jgi:hypothetical protein
VIQIEGLAGYVVRMGRWFKEDSNGHSEQGPRDKVDQWKTEVFDRQTNQGYESLKEEALLRATAK